MADIPTAARTRATKAGDAMPGGRFPNAIRAVGRAKGGEAGRAKVRRFIIKRARALNATSMIPDSWNSDGSLKS